MRTLLFSCLMVLVSVNQTQAQDLSILIGKWNVEYLESEDKAIYEFRKEGDKIIGYCIAYTDESGEVDDNLQKIISEIEIDGQVGHAKYMVEYDKEIYDLKCNFKIVDKNRIDARYSYLSYGGKEIWRRIIEK